MSNRTVVGTLAAVCLIGMQAQARASAPPLERMAYPAARAAILRTGWSPLPGGCHVMGGDTCTRFPEVDTCSGIAPGYCNMVFIWQGRCLYLGTVGGPPGGLGADTRVRSVTFRKGPCVKP